MIREKDLSSGRYSSRIGVGAATQFVGVVVQQVVKFLTNWLIGRLLGASVLGVFSLGFTFWSAVQMSYSGGLMRAIMRYLPHHVARDEVDQAGGVVKLGVYAAWIGGGVLAVIMYLLAGPVAIHVLNKPATAAVLRIFALAMPLAAVSCVIWATARSLGSLTFIVYQYMTVPAIFLVFVAPVAMLRGDASLLAWGFLASYLFPLLPLYTYFRRITNFLRSAGWRSVARPFAAFAGIAGLMWLAEFVSRNIDLFLVGRLRSAAEAGVYTIASRTSTLPSMVMVAFNTFFSPTVSALYANGRYEELRVTFRKASLWILIVGAPAIGILMALAEPVMRVFGKDFGVGGMALWILCLGQLINLGTGLISAALMMAGRQNSVLGANVAGVGITAGLCLLWVPHYGINGAAAAMAIAVVTVNLALCLWGYLTLHLSPLSGSYFKPLVATVAAGVGTHYLQPHLHSLPPKLLGGVIAFCLMYIVAMMLVGAKSEALAAMGALRQGMNRKRRES